MVPQKLVLGLLRAEPQVRWRWQDVLESKHEKLWSARILVAQSWPSFHGPSWTYFFSFRELCNIFLERYCESANEIYGIYEIYEIIEHKISRFHLPTAFFAKDTTGTRSGGGRSSIPCKTDGLILAIDLEKFPGSMSWFGPWFWNFGQPRLSTPT